ncbi:MAG: DUF1573 domain-containing protein [bacterium]
MRSFNLTYAWTGFKVFTLLLTIMFFLSCTKHATTSPYVVVPEKVYNFSHLYAGEKLTHEFIIKNNGEQTLLIEGIMSPCRCIFARINNREIKPHDQAILSVRFDTTGLEGSQDHRVIVYTNATNERILVFKIMGYVLQPFSLQPQDIDLGNLDSNAPLSQTIVFTSTSIGITAVTSLSPYIKTSLNKVSQNVYDIGLYLAKQLPAGLLKSKVLIYTTSTNFPVLTVPVKAKRLSDIQANPDEIFAGILLRNKSSSEFNTYVFSKHKKPFIIKDVHDTNNYLNIHTERFAPDVYRINVTAKPFTNTGEYTTDIMVLTTDNKTPVLQVPFRVLVMDK